MCFAWDPLPEFSELLLRLEINWVLDENCPHLDFRRICSVQPCCFLCFCVFNRGGGERKGREPWITVLWIRMRTFHSLEKEHQDVWFMHNPATLWTWEGCYVKQNSKLVDYFSVRRQREHKRMLTNSSQYVLITECTSGNKYFKSTISLIFTVSYLQLHL